MITKPLTYVRGAIIAIFSVCLLAMPSRTLARPLAATATPDLTASITSFFKKFVNTEGEVNYAAIKRNPLELKGLLRRIETFDAAAASENERKAFYINAYNMLVIGAVVENYPLESVEKVPGFFDKNLVRRGR